MNRLRRLGWAASQALLPVCMVALGWVAWPGDWAGATEADADSPAQAAMPVSAEARVSLPMVVRGIIGYTRWPVEARAIRLCVDAASPHAEDLASASTSVGRPLPITVHRFDPRRTALEDCDAIFFHSPLDSEQLAALRARANLPVLTLGEGRDFCSLGGMFCLEGVTGGVRFDVNLDAVARSGLHVNPWVLRLTRPRKGLSS